MSDSDVAAPSISSLPFSLGPLSVEEFNECLLHYEGYIQAKIAPFRKKLAIYGKTKSDLFGDMVLHLCRRRVVMDPKRVPNIEKKATNREEACQAAFLALASKAVTNKLLNDLRDAKRRNQGIFTRCGLEEVHDQTERKASNGISPDNQAIVNEFEATNRPRLNRLKSEAEAKWPHKLHVDLPFAEQVEIARAHLAFNCDTGESPQELAVKLGVVARAVKRALGSYAESHQAPAEPAELSVSKSEGTLRGGETMNLTCAQWVEQNLPKPGEPVDAAAMAAACGVGLNQAQRKIHQLGYFHKGSTPHYRALAEAAQKRRDSLLAHAEVPAVVPGELSSDSPASGPLPAEAPGAVRPAAPEPAARRAPSRRKKKPTWWASIVDRVFGIFGLKLVKKTPARRPKASA